MRNISMAVDVKLNKAKRNSGTIPVAKIEQDIDDFLESFKRKSSILDRRLSDESRESLGIPTIMSSSQYSTDDCLDDSSDRLYYTGSNTLLPPKPNIRGRPCSSNTSESEWGPEEDNSDTRSDNIPPDRRSHDAISENEGDVMGESVCPYSVLDVASLLQSKYAFVTGGKAKNGAPIMTFPENAKQPEIPEDDYRKIVSYLCYVPPLHETEQGFVIVIDRRQESWANVKTMLLRFSGFFPKHIQVVFLLQPHGFFQRAFADSKSKFVKEELEYKVVLCNGPEEMFDYIDPHQLTREVGGVLEYDANEWTQHRAAVEKFLSNTEKISTAVQLKVKKFQDTEIPNDVKGMEAVIQDHGIGRNEILDDLSSGDTQGKTLLDCIKGDNPRTPFIHQTHVIVLERLLVQLEETKEKFEEFWGKHEMRLKQCLQLRRFEEEFKLFQYAVERRIEWLNNKMSEVGETVQEVENLAQEFEDFAKEAEKDAEQAEKMRTAGEQLIMDDHYAVDSIRPKCIELQRMCDQYRQLLRRRRELLEKSHDLQDRIDNANKWCNQGFDLLANQQLENCKTQEGADLAQKDIENFVRTSSQLRLNNPKEFRQLFEGMITPETRTSVQKVLKRIEDVQGMCEKRKESLTKTVAVPKRPVHAVKPEPVSTSQVDGDLKRKGNTENTYRHPDIYEKSARLRTDVASPSRPFITSPCPSSQSFSSISDSASDKARNSYSSMSTTTSSGSSVSDTDTMLAKRRHVLNELIETEKTYVNQLEDILKGYCYEMDNRHMQYLIPEGLVDKKEILFGNLEQIYNFHKNIFLHELQNCQDAPAKVGKCFVRRNEEFHLYSIYCQNKLRSEALRNQIGDQNPFFMECQRRLNHKLPLGAYLLKPVQRITKYQLLLKEMLRFTDHDKDCETQLQEALDSMLDVVRYVNDSMHQVSIVGFPGNLADQGRLLMQGGFAMSTEHKREKIKDLRFKPMQRHMFLYEKSILLCKKKEEQNQYSEKRIYSFKNLLNMAQVGLTENIKGDKKKYELWLRGREEVYIIQAPSLPVKEMWVKEIKRVLMNQFDQLKVTKYLNLSNGRSTEDLSQPDKGSGNSNYVDNWRTQQGYNNNTSSTVPVGLEMMSPESPPGVTEADDDDGWSSGEFSNSEDDAKKEDFSSPIEPNYLQQFRSIGDYAAADSTEVTLREGDLIQILRTGSTGWWYARHMVTNQEGWVPSTYLQPALKSRSHLSVSSGESSQDNVTSKSSLTSTTYSTTSPVEETTV